MTIRQNSSADWHSLPSSLPCPRVSFSLSQLLRNSKRSGWEIDILSSFSTLPSRVTIEFGQVPPPDRQCRSHSLPLESRTLLIPLRERYSPPKQTRNYQSFFIREVLLPSFMMLPKAPSTAVIADAGFMPMRQSFAREVAGSSASSIVEYAGDKKSTARHGDSNRYPPAPAAPTSLGEWVEDGRP